MDWLADNFWHVVGTVATFLGVGLSFQRWRAKVKEKAEAQWAAKADLKEIEALHQRIARHKRDSDEQARKNYNAILDLYRKDEKTQSLILQVDQRASDRHEAVMAAVNNLATGLAVKK